MKELTDRIKRPVKARGPSLQEFRVNKAETLKWGVPEDDIQLGSSDSTCATHVSRHVNRCT